MKGVSRHLARRHPLLPDLSARPPDRGTRPVDPERLGLRPDRRRERPPRAEPDGRGVRRRKRNSDDQMSKNARWLSIRRNFFRKLDRTACFGMPRKLTARNFDRLFTSRDDWRRWRDWTKRGSCCQLGNGVLLKGRKKSVGLDLPDDWRVFTASNLTSQSVGREKGEGAAS